MSSSIRRKVQLHFNITAFLLHISNGDAYTHTWMWGTRYAQLARVKESEAEEEDSKTNYILQLLRICRMGLRVEA